MMTAFCIASLALCHAKPVGGRDVFCGDNQAPEPVFLTRQVKHPNGSTVDVHYRSDFVSAESHLASRDAPGDIDITDASITWVITPNDNSYCTLSQRRLVDTQDPAMTYSDCEAISTDLKAHPGYFHIEDWNMGANWSDAILEYSGTCQIGVIRLAGVGYVE
jgi:hypothetical protein